MNEGVFHMKRSVVGDDSDSLGLELYLVVVFLGVSVGIMLGVMVRTWCRKGLGKDNTHPKVH
ncbi:hypothetical protein DFH07DRAFT_949014 [Mycena maculata]|uniref:Uncharacterized protein n=1 Tax=Mycena maculata TaxID=230809 RepID=A0AAD7KD24_9AGAR|nr:hypothetical protein DFH07DRAFT_949014 [Mycena maculata]